MACQHTIETISVLELKVRNAPKAVTWSVSLISSTHAGDAGDSPACVWYGKDSNVGFMELHRDSIHTAQRGMLEENRTKDTQIVACQTASGSREHMFSCSPMFSGYGFLRLGVNWQNRTPAATLHEAHCTCRLEILDDGYCLEKLQYLNAQQWYPQSFHPPSETAPASGGASARAFSALVVLAPDLAAGVQQISRCLQPERLPRQDTFQNTCRNQQDTRTPLRIPCVIRNQDKARLFDDATSLLKCIDIGLPERERVADLTLNMEIVVGADSVQSQSACGNSCATVQSDNSGAAHNPETGRDAGSHYLDITWSSSTTNGMKEVGPAWTGLPPECPVSCQTDNRNSSTGKLAIPTTAQPEARVERIDGRDQMLANHGLTVPGAHDLPSFGIGSPYQDRSQYVVSSVQLCVGLYLETYPSQSCTCLT